MSAGAGAGNPPVRTRRRHWRRLLLPTLSALPVLAILIALGTWQVHRLHWKTDLLARIARAEAGPPVRLGNAVPEPWIKVVASGHFDNAREALLGSEVRGGGPGSRGTAPMLGAHLLVPLTRPDGPPLLVDRGWVPLERRVPVAHPEGEQSVIGYVRPGDTEGWLSATDDTAGRRFYTFVPDKIGAALELPQVAPYGLVALAGSGSPPGAWPEAATTLPQPPNSHLGYIITWYGLAAALAGVFAVWGWRRLHDEEGRA